MNHRLLRSLDQKYALGAWINNEIRDHKSLDGSLIFEFNQICRSEAKAFLVQVYSISCGILVPMIGKPFLEVGL
jgi:hypothetical protein